MPAKFLRYTFAKLPTDMGLDTESSSTKRTCFRVASRRDREDYCLYIVRIKYLADGLERICIRTDSQGESQIGNSLVEKSTDR